MFDFFTKHESSSYDHLDNEALIAKIDRYCARQIANMRADQYGPRKLLRVMFESVSENSPVIIVAAADRFNIESREETDPHKLLKEIATAANNAGIRETKNIMGFVILNEEMVNNYDLPLEEAKKYSSVFHRLSVAKDVPLEKIYPPSNNL